MEDKLEKKIDEIDIEHLTETQEQLLILTKEQLKLIKQEPMARRYSENLFMKCVIYMEQNFAEAIQGSFKDLSPNFAIMVKNWGFCGWWNANSRKQES